MIDNFDISSLDYCRSNKCTRIDVHPVHPVPGEDCDVVRVARKPRKRRRAGIDDPTSDPVAMIFEPDGSSWEPEYVDEAAFEKTYSRIAPDDWLPKPTRVSAGLLESTYIAISDRVPRRFTEVCDLVFNDYGNVSSRYVHHALRELVDHRKVASIAHPWWPPELQRQDKCSGFYVRYNSPALWNGGLRGLMSAVADHGQEKW